jgi:hypothetical protein
MAAEFVYDLDRRVLPMLLLLGFRPDRDRVTVTDDGRLVARYAWFRVDTPVANVASCRSTGPYQLIKSVGLRLSSTDSGVTFGTSARSGVCILFHDPVDRVIGLRPHRGLTVTVADPEGLIAAIEAAVAP